ncbi:MAG: hypothetical protein CMP10_17900 [Zetaproteobacteria bacterium]|nr:hypothetical protein [Pseudobdellovibrionaceae bacterium]|tara:strand:+ start:61 stop:990 length:930 start_codon:yes stop_codon:yes gene_type:complete
MNDWRIKAVFMLLSCLVPLGVLIFRGALFPVLRDMQSIKTSQNMPYRHIHSLKIMTWNMENLFMSTPFLTMKMKRIARIIAASDPDIVIMQEVGSLAVLESLRPLLRGQYHRAITLPDRDPRGIQSGIISKIKMNGKPSLAAGPGKRSILIATFETACGLLTVMGVHWPSQRNPFGARLRQSIALKQVVQDYQARQMPVVIAGDFNVAVHEERPLFNQLQDQFNISHRISCRSCPGTYYFRGQWSFLDAILVSKWGPWFLREDSVDVSMKMPGQVGSRGQPLKFGVSKGVSDHLPLVAKLNFKAELCRL